MDKTKSTPVRTAKIGDREAIRNLWRICFGDTEAFMDWFFSERYFPDYSACLLEEEEIMSAMQSYPLHIKIRNAVMPALMLAGVSTHPSRSGLGYMRAVFAHFMQIARNAGFPFVIHTPANIPTFHTRGHLPATDTLHFTLDGAQCPSMPRDVFSHSLCEDLSPLHICYNLLSQKYSGCVSRSIADFYYKFRDYASDGGKCAVCLGGGTVRGYCVYYALDDKLHGEECVTLDEGALTALLNALAFEANGRTLHVKLPPDARFQFPGANIDIRPQGVMGIADISAALKSLVGRDEFVFEITDNTVPENAGIWNGNGETTKKKPQIKLSAGNLAQLLCGYRSIDELRPDIETVDNDAAAELGALFPKAVCFIVDEY